MLYRFLLLFLNKVQGILCIVKFLWPKTTTKIMHDFDNDKTVV